MAECIPPTGTAPAVGLHFFESMLVSRKAELQSQRSRAIQITWICLLQGPMVAFTPHTGTTRATGRRFSGLTRALPEDLRSPQSRETQITWICLLSATMAEFIRLTGMTQAAGHHFSELMMVSRRPERQP